MSAPTGALIVDKGAVPLRNMRALYANLRIKHKLFLLLSAVLLTVAVLGGVLQQYAFDIYDQKIYEQSAKALSLSAVSIENELRKIEQLSYTIATDTKVQEYLRTIKSGGTEYDNYVLQMNIQDRVVNLGGLDKYIHSVQLYDVNDKAYATGVRTINLSSPRLERLKLETKRNEGGNTWVAPGEGDSSLSAAREIRSYKNLDMDYLGTIVVRVDAVKLFHDLSSGLDSSGANMMIARGTELIYPDKAIFSVEELSSLTDGSSGYRIMEREGNSFFVTYVASSRMNWYYYTIISFDDIFRNLVWVKNFVIAAFGLLFIISGIFALRVANGITKPIERLNANMKRIQLGYFDYVEDPAERALAMDEVGQMQRNFRIMVERINELIHENYVKQLAIKDTQFKALQANINPHFLYNTLDSINWSAKMSNQLQISQMVEALGSLLRTSINLKESIIPLRKELEIVSHYITIQTFRFEERLDFKLNVPEELLSCGLPKLALQPLIENAIHYGLEEMIDSCTISIQAYTEEGYLYIVVRDNGPGMEQAYADKLLSGEVQTKGTGLGLRNIEERIKLLYGEEYGLHVSSQPNEGAAVSLKLPYERKD